MNDHNIVQPTPQSALFAGAMATIAAGYLVRMVEIGWDPAKGKKKLVRTPEEDWHLGPQLRQAEVMAGIRAGCNAYLYRLPEGTWVVDTDTPEASAEMLRHLGKPDVITGRGGCHWLVDAQLDPVDGIDTDPRQLYGPGSFYFVPDGTIGGTRLVAYAGAVPPAPRHLPDNLPRKVAKAPRPVAPAGTGALADFAAGRDLRAITVAAANAKAQALLIAVATGPTSGAEARLGINNAAGFLGGLVACGRLEHAAAVEALETACEMRWGTCNAEDSGWIEKGMSWGIANPVTVYDPVDAVFGPGADDGGEGGDTEERRRKWQFFDAIGRDPFDPADGEDSDQGLADAVLRRTAPGLRRAVDTGAWIVRGPERWEELGDGGRAEWAISVLARLMPPGRKARADEEKTAAHWQAMRRERFVKAAGAGAIASKMRAITGGADHPAVVRVGDLDADAEVLWAGGVPWDLRASSGVLVPAAVDPASPHLHSAAVAPADVPTPLWDAYLAAVWPDAEVRAWALRVMSITLTGYPDAAVPVFYGPERTGKSSFVSLVIRLLGTYAHAADPRLLGSANAHASIVYALKGRRLSFIDEGPRRGQLATERLKQLTGGTELTGNAMNQNPITFAPTHTLVMTTNDEPVLTDAALAARMRIIPCEGDQDAVRAAREALTPAAWEWEAPGVLAAMIRESAAWLEHRSSALTISAPATVREQIAEISGTQDVFAAWLGERTRPSEAGTASRELYRNFVLWYRDNPVISERTIPSETAWGRAMTERGFPSWHTNNGKRRALTLSGGGDVSWAVAPKSDGSVHGFDGSEGPTRHPELRSSDAVSTPVMTGMTSSTTASSHKAVENTPENKMGSAMGETGHAVTPVTSLKPATAPLGPQPEPGSMINCQWCGSPAELTKSIKFKVHKTPAGERCDGSQQTPPGLLTISERKAHERARAKAAKITEAAGPVLELPAAMARGGDPRSVTLVEAAAIVRAAMARNGGRCSVDIETNARPMWHPEFAVSTIQLGDWAEAVDLDAADPEQRALAGRLLREAAEIEAYSYTADLAPLARIGVIEYDEALAKAIDVATLVKLTDPTLTENGDGLKETAAAVLGPAAVSPAAEAGRKAMGDAAGWIWQIKPDTPDDRNGWLQVDKRSSAMVRYACADVLDNAALRLKLPQPDPAVMAREIVAERVVAKLPYLGLALDGPAVRAQLSEREPRAAAKLARIRQLGVDNPDSPPQVTTRLTQLGAILPQTKKGNDSAKGDVLEKLQHAPGELGELARTILEWRDDATVLKNMIRPWARSTEHGDCRTYPTIYTLGADTGRMSCVRPNLQQVAREGGLRECIVADPGMLLIAADFSSVEVRVAAYLSGDQNLIAMVNRGIDLHAVIAEHAYGPGWTKAQRYNVKSVVFGRLYGGGVDTLAAQSGLTHEMTERLIGILDAIAPQLTAWSNNLRQAVKNGLREFKTYSGRIIHLDPRLPHKAPNFAIQGTARELLVDALIRWDAGPYRGGIVLPVHDEIVAMVRAEDAPAATQFLTRCMETQLGPVPITVEADEPAMAWQSAA